MLQIEFDEHGKVMYLKGVCKVRDIRKYGLIEASLKGGKK